MSIDPPPCPKCTSIYVYKDQNIFICPECSYEWDPDELIEDKVIIKDANGNRLFEGDKVSLIKDLKVKGSSKVLKVGSKATIRRFVDQDHDIDCRLDGGGEMMLKSKFVKKIN